MQVKIDPNPQATNGFTLVEVIIGMFLLAEVFTAAYGSYFLGMRIVEDAREELRASQIIQSELEAMRTLNWEDMEEIVGFQQFTPQGEFIQNFSKTYTCWRYVDADSGKKLVRIWVMWINSRGDKSYQLFTTIFTKNGINDYYYRQV